ncbi:MAG: LysE family translocator [Rhodobacteraceae bacterium]|nr:LysE family translocator [Paracoccaceae bacterium]
MTVDAALAFVAALMLWVLIPGPAILMVVGRSLSGGFRASISLIGGILLGDLFYMSLVFLGLAALGQMLGESFVVVRILAALYLVYLGVSLWRKDPEKTQLAQGHSAGVFQSFLTGFGITLGNPKAIIFHLGFLPTFFDLPALSLFDALLIMGIFVSVLGAAFAAYALAASRARHFFQSPRRMRLLNRTSGTMLIGAGAAVLLKRS